MLVGAVMGFWAVQRIGLARRSRIARRGARRRRDGDDPRVPRDHAACEPDRLGSCADDLRGCGGPLVVPRQRPEPRRPARAPHVRRRSCRTLAPRKASSGRSCFQQPALVFASWVCVVLVALYLNRTRLGPQCPCGRRGPAAADAMGHQRRRAIATRTRSRAVRSRASAARASRSRSRRSGSTASRRAHGWIAIALVIFAFWRPTVCLIGAYFFGAFSGHPVHVPGARDLERRPARALPGAART